MAKRSTFRLTAAVVKQATAPGYYSDGAGLVLQVTPAGAKSWLLRYRGNAGKIREMGLGGVASVSLQDARKAAASAMRMRAQGVDPIEARRTRMAAARADAAKAKTFKECAADYIEANRSGWRNAKHAAQWSATLASYAFPVFGSLPASAVDTSLIVQVLQPLWACKHETATRVRQRIERVLAYATTAGFRTGENPARWRGHLDQILPATRAVRRSTPIKHHAALPVEGVAAFMHDVAERQGGAALGLRFLVLTAARTGEVIGATCCEIDMTAKIWAVPAERMKGGREHRVPLSPAAIALLRAAGAHDAAGDRPIFLGPTGRALSNMAFTALLKRMGRGEFTPHGLRSTFRVWAADRTNYPREVCEAALAHVIGSDTERAYMRSDMFARRARLMNEWATFATATPRDAVESKSVVPLREAKRGA